jgi:NCS2 family nucleobase:cation symporter-2
MSATEMAATYDADDVAPTSLTWLSALQHVGILSAYLVFPLVVVREAGVSSETAAAVLALSMLALGVATVLQAVPRVGCGFLCPVTFTAAYIAPAIYASKIGGLHLAFGMVAFAGLLEVALSAVFRRVRWVFPPEVAGVVILLVGLTIGAIAVRNIAAFSGASAGGATSWVGTALVLGAMTALAVWGRGAWRTLSVLIGLAGGYAAALALGLLPKADLAAIAAAPLVAPPRLDHLGITFDLSLVVPFAVAAMAAATKAAALSALAQTAAGPRHRGDPEAVMARGVRADGLGTIIAGLLGTIGVNPGPSSVSLVKATGLASRRIAWATGAIFAALALLPPLALALATLPRAVIAGMLLFTGSLVLTNGLQMIVESRLDPRKTMVVGLGVFAALAAELNPGMAQAVTPMLAPIAASPLVLGTAVAIGANILLRPGAARMLA